MNSKKERIKRFTIVCLLIIISLFSVSYAVLAENLNVTSPDIVDASWNIEIISIDSIEKTGLAQNAYEPRILSSKSASFGVNLFKPGDSIIYRVKIKNNGTIDAYLEDVIVTENNITENKSAIKYGVFEPSDKRLSANDVNEINLIIYYDNIDEISSQEEKNYVIDFIYVQKRN